MHLKADHFSFGFADADPLRERRFLIVYKNVIQASIRIEWLDFVICRWWAFAHSHLDIVPPRPKRNQKIWNRRLHIKIDIVPFKVISIDCNALMIAVHPFLVLGVLRFLMAWHLMKSVAGSCLFYSIEQNEMKGAKSGEFGDYWMVHVVCSTINLRIMVTLCDIYLINKFV